MITSSAPRLRLRGHGRRLRLHANGSAEDSLAIVSECCRASLAIEKAMGEAVRSARSAGRGWGEIAAALGTPVNATTGGEVMAARAEQQRQVWQRFWQGETP